MTLSDNPNLPILEASARRLGPLTDVMVFLGGCATGLLITDPAAPALRITRDVDVIVEAASLRAYHRLSAELHYRGFREDTSPDAPICRWKSSDVILDVMPTDPQILGFGNRWFQPAFLAAESVTLPSGNSIKVPPPPYFLATKLEAFEGRGQGDFLVSADMEDLVALLDGRRNIVDEIHASDENLAAYLAHRFGSFLRDPAFIESLPGHLPPDPASQARISMLIKRLRDIAQYSGISPSDFSSP